MTYALVTVAPNWIADGKLNPKPEPYPKKKQSFVNPLWSEQLLPEHMSTVCKLFFVCLFVFLWQGVHSWGSSFLHGTGWAINHIDLCIFVPCSLSNLCIIWLSLCYYYYKGVCTRPILLHEQPILIWNTSSITNLTTVPINECHIFLNGKRRFTLHFTRLQFVWAYFHDIADQTWS